MRKSVWIEKLPQGYSVRYWQTTSVGPRLQREWFKEYNLAQTFMANKKLQLLAEQQGTLDPTLTTLHLFEKYIQWCKDNSYREGTIEFKQSHMKDFVNGSLPIVHWTETTIEDFIGSQRIGPSTKNMRRTEIKAFLNWCAKRKYIIKTPEIPISAVEVKRRKITEDELIKLEEHLDPKFKVFYTLIKEHGTRSTETRLAKGEDFNLVDKVWIIPAANSKGKADKFIPLSEKSLATLMALAVEGKLQAGPLFPNWRRAAPNYYLNKAKKAAGLEDRIFPHLFRHTRASNWKGNVYALMSYMGWKSWAMGKRYSHHDIEDLRREANKE